MEYIHGPRILLSLTAIVLIVGLSFIGDGGTKPSGQAVRASCETCFTLYTWENYIDPYILKQFREEFGTKVDLVEFSDMEDLRDQYLKSPGSVDVMIIDGHSAEVLADDLGIINDSRLSNLQNVNPKLMLDKKVTIPYQWGTTGIAYNKKHVFAPVTDWSIFWDHDYDGLMAVLDDHREVATVALQELGFSTNTEDPDEVTRADANLQSTKVKVLGPASIISKMVTNELLVAQMYNGDAHSVILANADVAYVIPKDGGTVWADGIAMSAESKRRDVGYQFMDFLLRPDVAAKNSEYSRFASSLDRSLLKGKVPDELLENPVI